MVKIRKVKKIIVFSIAIGTLFGGGQKVQAEKPLDVAVTDQLTIILTKLTKIKDDKLSKYNYPELVLTLLDIVTSNNNGHRIVRDNYLYQGIINMRKNKSRSQKQQNILDYLLVYLYLNKISDNDNYLEKISQAYRRLNFAVPKKITRGLLAKQKTEQKINRMVTKANGELFYQDAQGKAKKIFDARQRSKGESLKIEGHNYPSEAVEKFKQQIEERVRVSTQYQDSVQSKKISSVDDLKARYDLNQKTFYSANDANHPECGNLQLDLSTPESKNEIVEVLDSFHATSFDYSNHSLFSDQLPEQKIGINPLTIKQGTAGDCYFLATLFGMAINDTDYLRSLMVDKGNFVYVKFYYQGQPIYYKVSKKLSAEHCASESSLWVRILEKAVASYRNNPDQKKKFIFSEDSYGGRFGGGYQRDIVDAFYPNNYRGNITYTIKSLRLNRDQESIVTFNRMNGNYSKDALQVFWGMQQVLSTTGGIVNADRNMIGKMNLYRDQIDASHQFSVIQCLANQKTATGDLVNLVTIRNPWGSDHGVPQYIRNSLGEWILVPDAETNQDVVTLELKDFCRLFSEIELSFYREEIPYLLDEVLKVIDNLQKSSESIACKKETLTNCKQYRKLMTQFDQLKLSDPNDDRTKANQMLSEFLVNLLNRTPPADQSKPKYQTCLQIITQLIKNESYQEAINFMTIYDHHSATKDYHAIITEFTTKLVNKMSTDHEKIFKRALVNKSFSESDQQQFNQNDELLDELWYQISDDGGHDLLKVFSDLKYASLYCSDARDFNGSEFCGWLVYMINWLKELRGKLVNPDQPIAIDYDTDLTQDDDLATDQLNLAYQDLEQVKKYNEEIRLLREVKTLIESYEEFSSGKIPASDQVDFINEMKTRWQDVNNWATHFYSDHDYLCLLAQAQLDYYERLKQPH